MEVAKQTQIKRSPYDLRLQNPRTDARHVQASTESNLGAPQRDDVFQRESDDAEPS